MKQKSEESKNVSAVLPVKRNVLHITNENLIKRIEYDKQISQLKGTLKNNKKKEFKMTEEEKEINRKILYNMNLKLNFVKNPRYREQHEIPSYSTTEFKPIESKENPFSVEPKEVLFEDYQPGNVYQIDIIILNRTSLLTTFKYVGPLTQNFMIKEVIYPKRDSNLIAAGMHAKIKVAFHATSMENFEDEIVIMTEKMSFKIPIKAKRDKPTLSLVNPMNCKKCFIGDRTEIHFLCKNNGGDAHFKFFIPDADNNEKVQDNSNFNELLNVGPFTIFPQEFYLYKGMAQNISVSFAPEVEGIVERNIILICDNSELKYTLKGEGIKVDIEIKSVDGLYIEETHQSENTNSNKSNIKESNTIKEEEEDDYNEYMSEDDLLKVKDVSEGVSKKLETLFFDDTYPFTSKSRIVVLKNTSSVSIKFHWTIYDIYHQNEFSIQPDEVYFSIEPEDGVFGPYEEKEFKIQFTPSNSVIYEQKLDLIIENIPFPAIKQFVSSSAYIKNTFTKAEPYLPGFNSSFPSYPLYSFTLCGQGKLPKLEIDKTYIDLGDVYLNQIVKDNFYIKNTKTGKVKFKINQIIQKLLINENSISNRFYNDRGIEEDSLFKEKKKYNERPDIIERDYLYEDQCQSDYKFIDVNYLNIYIEDNKSNEDVCSSVQSSNDQVLKKLKTKKKNPILSPLKTDKSNKNSCNINEFIDLNKEQSMYFGLTFKGTSLGLFKSSIIFTLDDGKPIAIDVKANIIGPKIGINTSLIDFGIFPLSKIQHKFFEIENISKIPCNYFIKECRYKNVHINNYNEYDYIQDFEGILQEKDLTYKNKIETILQYESREADLNDASNMDSYKLKFSSCYGTLQPGEKRNIELTFFSPYPIHITTDYTIEVEIENGSSEYINYIAQCEEVEAYIENTMILPNIIFLTIPIEYEDNTITITNPSNLPIHFKWNNVFEADHRTATFEPNFGEIAPHSKQKIKYKIVYNFLTKIDDLFICKIDELDIPLGVVLQGEVTGLNISYELTQDSCDRMANSMNTTLVGLGNNSKETRRQSTRRTSRLYSNKNIKEQNSLEMKKIVLRHLKVNTPNEITFKIKNLSGIPTSFHLNVEKYAPGKEKAKSDKEQTSTVVTKLSKLSKKSRQVGFKVDHPLLTAAHEENNFTSPKGLEFTKQKQIEKDSLLYLSNNKGVAIVIEPKKGRLKPNEEVLIKLSFFNECVGEFEDTLISKVKGLDTVKFPIYLRIKGNPLQLCPFQSGINYLLSPQLMKIGSIIRGGEAINKKVKFVNIGTNTITLDWKIYDNEDVQNPNSRNVFDIKIRQRRNNHYTLDFNITEPNEFLPDKRFFTIQPEHAVVGPKETHDFNVTFHTNEEGQKLGLLIAYPRIEDESGNIKLSFNELPLNLMGTGLIPKLHVDKNLTFDNKYVYKFCVHSYGKHPRPKRSIILINKEKINMIIDIEIYGPFKIEHIEPVEAILSKMKCNIIPNSNLKLEVKFLIPSAQNTQEWPMLLHVEKEGKIVVKFQNGEYEEYYLKAILKRPRILLSFTGNKSVESSDTVDFGYVNCACKKVEKMFLMNETDVDTNWKISYVKFKPKVVYGYGTITEKEKEDKNMSDDPSVFIFEQTEGFIYGPSNMLIDLPLGPALPKLDIYEERKYKPLCIQIMFQPKKNVFYKCRYIIETSTGNTVDFILKGNGSYLEEHIIK